MPSGEMPSYEFRPLTSEVTRITTHSTRRARLYTGGTYFRINTSGGHGNYISVQAFEYISEVPGEVGELRGKCVVTNHNIMYTENLEGPAKASFIDMQMGWNELVKIENIDTLPTARKYSISFKIAPSETLQSELGPFTFNSLFHVPSKLSAKLSLDAQNYAPGDAISIKPRYRVYDLKRITVQITPDTPGTPAEGENPGTPGTPGETIEGWDIDDLRAQINADNPWLTMPPRPKITATGVVGSASDPQDHGYDAFVLELFSEAFCSGGDGLPPTPVKEHTGAIRSLVHINYGERADGGIVELNTLYEWVGENITNGTWQQY